MAAVEPSNPLVLTARGGRHAPLVLPVPSERGHSLGGAEPPAQGGSEEAPWPTPVEVLAEVAADQGQKDMAP